MSGLWLATVMSSLFVSYIRGVAENDTLKQLNKISSCKPTCSYPLWLGPKKGGYERPLACHSYVKSICFVYLGCSKERHFEKNEKSVLAGLLAHTPFGLGPRQGGGMSGLWIATLMQGLFVSYIEL